MLSISGGDPSFRDDDGSACPDVAVALARFSAGAGSEHAAMTALAGSRLLVPVVAVLSEQLSGEPSGPPRAASAPRVDGEPCEAPEAGGEPDTARGDARGIDGEPEGQRGGAERANGKHLSGERAAGRGGEKASEMAMPTLIGLDGRRAVPAFTCLDSMHRWQPDARPVPVTALAVWQAAVADSCAVVIDVAGPVPFAVEGSRLAALARGEAAPLPCSDADVHEIVADVLAGQLDVSSFELLPGDGEQDLMIALTMAHETAGRAASELAAEIGNAVMARLGGRLRRGVAILFRGDRGRS